MTGANARGEAHYPYENCGRLVETEENLYFVTARGEVVMLAKSGLQGGKAEQLREFLRENLRPERRVLSEIVPRE